MCKSRDLDGDDYLPYLTLIEVDYNNVGFMHAFTAFTTLKSGFGIICIKDSYTESRMPRSHFRRLGRAGRAGSAGKESVSELHNLYLVRSYQKKRPPCCAQRSAALTITMDLIKATSPCLSNASSPVSFFSPALPIPTIHLNTCETAKLKRWRKPSCDQAPFD